MGGNWRERFRGPSRERYLRIAVISALMASVVFVVGYAVREATSKAVLEPAAAVEKPALPYEAGVFRRLERPVDYSSAPATKNDKRTLPIYYARRAFSGAPPSIPHKLLDPMSWGGKSCNVCHLDGGWSADFNAYTPVTPHPELVSCRQCHVPAEEKTAFRETTFAGLRPPEVPKGALKGSPPAIPHELDMRTNCVACHGGPAASPELRTTHPERVNCRQCHALGSERVAEFQRPGYGGGGN